MPFNGLWKKKRVLLAHEVGSGKTLTMLGAGFKLKELGMVHKPLYVVPSSLTLSWPRNHEVLPNQECLCDDQERFCESQRKQFVSRIITGDYDAIVIGDSQFEKIPMSQEKQVAYIQDKLNQLREIKQGSDSDYTVKEAERSIKGLEHQLEELQKLERDTFIEFENLGIDFSLRSANFSESIRIMLKSATACNRISSKASLSSAVISISLL